MLCSCSQKRGKDLESQNLDFLFSKFTEIVRHDLRVAPSPGRPSEVRVLPGVRYSFRMERACRHSYSASNGHDNQPHQTLHHPLTHPSNGYVQLLINRCLILQGHRIPIVHWASHQSNSLLEALARRKIDLKHNDSEAHPHCMAL